MVMMLNGLSALGGTDTRTVRTGLTRGLRWVTVAIEPFPFAGKVPRPGALARRRATSFAPGPLPRAVSFASSHSPPRVHFALAGGGWPRRVRVVKDRACPQQG